MPDNLPREERDILITLVADVKHLAENQGSFHSEIKAQIAELKDGFAQRLNVAEGKLEALELTKFSKVDFVAYRNDLVAKQSEIDAKVDRLNTKLIYYTGGIAVCAIVAEAAFQYLVRK